eukprot:150661_1
MFLPDNLKDTSKSEQAEEETKRRKAYGRIEQWSKEAIPESIQEGLIISVQEVECGDPNCAPVDTAITILFPSGGSGMVGIPMESKDVTKEDLLSFFPTEYVPTKWYKGQEALWPPG